MKTMAEVLAEHWSVSTHADKDNEPLVDKCDGCGKVLHTWGDQIPEIHPLAAHQATVLSAAGFGLVADAKAEAHKLKSVRGELKTLGRNLDSWETEGHTTATIRFLRQWISRATKAAS